MSEKKDSFDKEFETLRELSNEGSFVLRGATIIVELLPDEELKLKGTNIVIATDMSQVKGNSTEQHKLQVAKVQMTGPGYWTDDDEFEPLDIEPGAIVILPKYSTELISVFPGLSRPTGNRIGMIKESAILAYYPNEAAYSKARAQLN